MACQICRPHPSNDYICAGAGKKWPYVAKVNMSLEEDGLWKLEDRDDGTDTWEWVTTLKPMDVNFVCGSTDKEVTTVTSKKRGRGKERNNVGGRRRRRK